VTESLRTRGSRIAWATTQPFPAYWIEDGHHAGRRGAGRPSRPLPKGLGLASSENSKRRRSNERQAIRHGPRDSVTPRHHLPLSIIRIEVAVAALRFSRFHFSDASAGTQRTGLAGQNDRADAGGRARKRAEHRTDVRKFQLSLSWRRFPSPEQRAKQDPRITVTHVLRVRRRWCFAPA